ncbi:protein bicaudal C [Paragonimus westermani]|uniref:Protein bicaudal C n=1 Tax=Paragonimus westermani TaxID=34504 RepID=A0A5J4NSM5_9TREM|nr:protein bicaudal C [Paragonimus westermani]
MFETQCHVHFPDSNRTSLVEKSNQVTISGHVNNVDRARQRIRDMLPITFIFCLPLNSASQTFLLHNTAFVRQLEIAYGVEVCHRMTNPSLTRTQILLSVRGLSVNSRKVKTVVQSLLQHCYKGDTPVPITMTMELDPAHKSVFLGQKTLEDLNKLVMQATGASLTFKTSDLLGGQERVRCDLSVVENSPRRISMQHGFSNTSMWNPDGLRTVPIKITGSSVDSVFLARQLITNLLPVALIFDVTMEDSKRLKNFDFARLREQYDVLVEVRAKQKQPLWSFVVRTSERNIRAVYTTWHLIKGFIALSKPVLNLPIYTPGQAEERYFTEAVHETGLAQNTDELSFRTSAWAPLEKINSGAQNLEPRCGELPSLSFNKFDTGQLLQSDNSSLKENIVPKQSLDWISSILDKMGEVSLNSAAYEDNAQLRLAPSRPSALSLTFPLNTQEDNQNQYHVNHKNTDCSTFTDLERKRFDHLFPTHSHYNPPPRVRRAAAGWINPGPSVVMEKRHS